MAVPKLYEVEGDSTLPTLLFFGDVAADECCCDDCCVEPGGPPTADFSYEQTDDDPCCFNFTDESVAGTCGSIVEWLWDFGDGNTSTASDPSHCYASLDEGPWNVTLTVTDIAGCTDVVVMEVDCLSALECCTGDFMPETVTLTWGQIFSGIPSNNCAGEIYATPEEDLFCHVEVNNRSMTLQRSSTGYECRWEATEVLCIRSDQTSFRDVMLRAEIWVSGPGFFDPPGSIRVKANITISNRDENGAEFAYIQLHYGGDDLSEGHLFTSDTCRGSWVIPYDSLQQTGPHYCSSNGPDLQVTAAI